MPEIDEYKPTNEGLPPLARAKKEDWNVFRGDRLDYNVMPGWAGSSWYFIRFIDPKNDIYGVFLKHFLMVLFFLFHDIYLNQQNY